MKPRVVLMSDFGTDNIGTVVMEGVINTLDPDVRVTNLTHSIKPFNMWQASSALAYAEPYWPKGTIFVSVVDPGVGTKRRASVAKLKDGNYVVTPDNGTLTHMYYEIGIEEIREIDENVNRLQSTKKTSIFHGRDLFAYCAGKLAAGLIDFEGVGPKYPVEEVVLLEEMYHPVVKEHYAQGCIVDISRQFGNVFTNIPVDDFEKAGFVEGDEVTLHLEHEGKTLYEKKVTYAHSFGGVGKSEPLVFNGSTLHICFGLNMDNFIEKCCQLEIGTNWKVVISK